MISPLQEAHNLTRKIPSGQFMSLLQGRFGSLADWKYALKVPAAVCSIAWNGLFSVAKFIYTAKRSAILLCRR